jgi:hypothetical protein
MMTISEVILEQVESELKEKQCSLHEYIGKEFWTLAELRQRRLNQERVTIVPKATVAQDRETLPINMKK